MADQRQQSVIEFRYGWSSVSDARLVCHRNAQGRDDRGVARRCGAREDLACVAGRAPLAPFRSDSSDHLPDSSIDCHTSTWAALRNRQARLWRHRPRAGNRRSQQWEYIPGWQRASRSIRLRTQAFEAFLSGYLGSFVPSVGVPDMLAKLPRKLGALIRGEHGAHRLHEMRQVGRAPASELCVRDVRTR